MMEKFRHHSPRQINGSAVLLKKDYLTLEATNFHSGEKSKLNFSTTSDVLQYFMEDGSKISIRPSGTEPKIKFYFEARSNMSSLNDFEQAQKEANNRIDRIIESLDL